MEIELTTLNTGDTFVIGKQIATRVMQKFYSQGITKNTILSVVKKYKNGMILVDSGYESYALDSYIAKSLFVSKVM